MNDRSSDYTGVPILRVLERAKNYNAYLLDLIERGAGDSRHALDFGAGVGTFSKLLRQRGFDVSCVEKDEFLAQELRSAGLSTARDLAEIEAASLEFIFSLNVFEHIPDDALVVRALYDKLRVGGRLFIYVPAFDCLWTSLDDRVRHYRRYTIRRLVRLVRSVRLRVVECRYADSLGFIAALLFKIIGDKHGDLDPRQVDAYDKIVMPISRRLDWITSSFIGKNVHVTCMKE
jgi:SAM-dependent methyltransferase